MTREEAIEWFKGSAFYSKDHEPFNMAIKALEQEPKTGHWTHDGSHWKNRFICSECGYKLFEEQTNYCPNCGARMAESEDKE